jgi:hypothetical protein
MLCNNAEYKKMGQDMSLGQLYNVQNEINILYKALCRLAQLLRQYICYKLEYLSHAGVSSLVLSL